MTGNVCACLLLGLAVACVSCQDRKAPAWQGKAAVVSLRDVLTGCEAGKHAIREIQDAFAERRARLSRLGQDILAAREAANAAGGAGPKAAELSKMVGRYAEDEQALHRDMNLEEQRKLKPITDKILRVLRNYARENAIMTVRERETFLYYDPAMDITDDILKWVNLDTWS